MIYSVICPHCLLPNSYNHIKEQLHDSLREPLTVKCKACAKYFDVEIQFKVLPITFKGQGKCTCDPRDWRENTPEPVCDKFISGPERNCINCEHDEECHNA